METNKVIGSNIKSLREKLGLTQEALAEFLNISRVEISYYEGGIRRIPTQVIIKAAQIFGVDEYDLYEDNLEFRESTLAFAFRADCLNPSDLEHIAGFKKLVQNYLKMHQALEGD